MMSHLRSGGVHTYHSKFAYLPKSKPRQSYELNDFAKDLRDREYTGIVALKRDGWFVEITISEVGAVTYSTYTGKFKGFSEKLQGLFDGQTFLRPLSTGSEPCTYVLYGELYVENPPEENVARVEAGYFAVGHAVNAFAMHKDLLRQRLKVNIFRVQSLGDLNGASLRSMPRGHYATMMMTIQILLRGQPPNIKCIPYATFECGATPFEVKYQRPRECADSFLDVAVAEGAVSFKDLYALHMTHIARTYIEGFVFCIDEIFDDQQAKRNRRVLPGGEFHRIQSQIKCKPWLEGVFHVQRRKHKGGPDSVDISDSRHSVVSTSKQWSQVVLRMSPIVRASLTYAAYSEGFNINLRAVSAQCVDSAHPHDLRLNGIKYVYDTDMRGSDASVCNLETLCEMNPHIMYLRVQSGRFFKWLNAYCVSHKRKKGSEQQHAKVCDSDYETTPIQSSDSDDSDDSDDPPVTSGADPFFRTPVMTSVADPKASRGSVTQNLGQRFRFRTECAVEMKQCLSAVKECKTLECGARARTKLSTQTLKAICAKYHMHFPIDVEECHDLLFKRWKQCVDTADDLSAITLLMRMYFITFTDTTNVERVWQAWNQDFDQITHGNSLPLEEFLHKCVIDTFTEVAERLQLAINDAGYRCEM